MAVKIGSARIDENGNTHGGAAGDQRGGEVSTQNWYLHNKGWVCLRAKDARIRELIAQAMEWACANNDIGYDQYQRDTLYNNVKASGFDPRKTTKKVETDCSALVRVCIQHAFNQLGIDCMVGNFRTVNEPSYITKTGYFDKLTDADHCKKSTMLARGDILCTPVSGHTVVVLSNGTKCDAESAPAKEYKLGDRELSKGCTGSDVKELQKALIAAGYSCGTSGADGDFGSATLTAVKAFQKANNLDVDGVVGLKTIDALCVKPAQVCVKMGYTLNIRTGAGTSCALTGKYLHGGDTVEYTETKIVDGTTWYHISAGWISGKYVDVGD